MLAIVLNWEMIEHASEIITLLVTVGAAFVAVKELHDSKKTAKGEFILNLQQAYADNGTFADLFEQCWHNYNNDLSDEALSKYLEEHEKELLNYLTFFESMYLMTEDGLLKMETLDELFGRRFMIVVSNKKVQETDLVKNAAHYENVFKLYDKWCRYRDENKLFLNNGKNKNLIVARVEYENHKEDA